MPVYDAYYMWCLINGSAASIPGKKYLCRFDINLFVAGLLPEGPVQTHTQEWEHQLWIGQHLYSRPRDWDHDRATADYQKIVEHWERHPGKTKVCTNCKRTFPGRVSKKVFRGTIPCVFCDKVVHPHFGNPINSALVNHYRPHRSLTDDGKRPAIEWYTNQIHAIAEEKKGVPRDTLYMNMTGIEHLQPLDEDDDVDYHCREQADDDDNIEYFLY